MASNICSIALRSARQGLKLSTRAQGNVAGRFSSGGPVPPKVKARQDMLQIADGTPVHIKGGTMDQILYRFTMGCCALSVVLILGNLYRMANKK